MAPMPSMKGQAKPDANNFLYVPETNNFSSTPPSPPSTADPAKSQCSSLSDGESFEGYGTVPLNQQSSHERHNRNHADANDGNNNLNGSAVAGVELELAPHANPTNMVHIEDDLNITPRDNWTRMSLRRAPTSNPDNISHRRWGSMRHSGRRQLGSNAIASQLYRSSSFNSSGRSSNCDTTDDIMFSDVSLDNVQDLNYKFELLQRQVTDLADEDRSTRAKTEYAVLQTRYHILQEQFQEAEIRAEERLAEEQKLHRELLTRVEREADRESELQNENYQIKIRTIEVEASALRDEAQRLRVLCDKQANDLHRTEEKLEQATTQIAILQEEHGECKQRERHYEQEKQVAADLMVGLSKELERLRAESGPAMPTTSPETIRLEELHRELENMRQKNKALEEQNEELQAAVLTRGVEEGRHLLNGTLNSLAQELEEMSQAQDTVDSATLISLSQLQQAYQEKEDENTRLKHYIDTILLNIVENYPQLLEVKPVQQK